MGKRGPKSKFNHNELLFSARKLLAKGISRRRVAELLQISRRQLERVFKAQVDKGTVKSPKLGIGLVSADTTEELIAPTATLNQPDQKTCPTSTALPKHFYEIKQRLEDVANDWGMYADYGTSALFEMKRWLDSSKTKPLVEWREFDSLCEAALKPKRNYRAYDNKMTDVLNLLSNIYRNELRRRNFPSMK